MATNETSQLASRLIALAQLDIDAFFAYQQAIEATQNDPDVRDPLIAFQEDHERHVRELQPIIRRYGGEPPTFQRDLKGVVLEGMTAITRLMGTKAALMAMKGNETLTNKAYQAALALDLEEDERLLIRRNFGDEQRHMDFIDHELQGQKWVDEHDRAVEKANASPATGKNQAAQSPGA